MNYGSDFGLGFGSSSNSLFSNEFKLPAKAKAKGQTGKKKAKGLGIGKAFAFGIGSHKIGQMPVSSSSNDLGMSKEALWSRRLSELVEENSDTDTETFSTNLLRERLEIPNFWKTFNGYETELSFPLMTICPSYKFRASLLKKFDIDRYGCKPGQRYCSWDIPYNLATHTETIIKMCKYKKHYSCFPGIEENGKWTRTLTSMGRCFTFAPTEPIRSAGDSNAFEIQVDPILWDKWGNGSGIRVYIHDRNEIPLVEITGININHGSAAIFSLQVKEFDRVNDLRRNTCETGRNYSQSKCIMRCVYDLARHQNPHGNVSGNAFCGAPFMQAFDIKACFVKETIESLVATFDSVVNNGSAWNKCNARCPEPCKQRTYTPITTSLGFTSSNSSLVNITIYFSDMWVERIVEHWDYNFEEFVADTGGSLNLFLGASFVSIIQFSDYFLAMFGYWVKSVLARMKALQNKVLAFDKGAQGQGPRKINAIEVSW